MMDSNGAIEKRQAVQASNQPTVLPVLDLKRLNRHLAALAQRPPQSPEALIDALKLAVTLVNAGAAALFEAGTDGARPREQLLSRQALSWDEGLPARMAACAALAMQEASLQIQHLPGFPQAAILSAPLPSPYDAPPRAALTLVALLGEQGPEIFAASLQLFAAFLGLWMSAAPTPQLPAGQQPLQAPRVLPLLASALAHGDASSAQRALADGLRAVLASDCVVVLGRLGRGGRVRPVAASGLSELGQGTAASHALEQALTEAALLNQATTAGPASAQDVGVASPVLAELAQSLQASQALCLPIRDNQDRLHGSVLLLDSQGAATLDKQLARLTPLLPVLGGCLHALRPLPQRLWSKSHPARGSGRRGWLVAAGASLLLALLALLPVEFDISGPCLIQPAARRWVAAPFDGLLEKVLFKPGAEVRQGDLLARMDGREIELELGTLLADLGKAAKMRDVQLVAGNTAEAQIAGLEKERLEQRLELLERRKGQLELRSPIDGIVLSGDLERVEGAAVAKGKLLCEIAPLDAMRVEIAVAQEDVRHISEGRLARIELEAHPGHTWQGAIRTIWPKSEIREERSVFIAEVESDNPQGLLRPGMKGKARIPIERRALAWVLFHRPWARLMSALGV